MKRVDQIINGGALGKSVLQHDSVAGAVQNALQMWATGEGNTKNIIDRDNAAIVLDSEERIREYAANHDLKLNDAWVDKPENLIRGKTGFIGGVAERDITKHGGQYDGVGERYPRMGLESTVRQLRGRGRDKGRAVPQ